MDQSAQKACEIDAAQDIARPIAIFDLDRTITDRGSYTPFLIFASSRLFPWRLLGAPLTPFAMIAYKAGFISRKRLKELMLGLFLGRAETWRLTPVLRDFVAQYLRRHLRPEALAAIRAERNRGARLILATASFDFYAQYFAEALKFDDMVATGSTHESGRLLPKVVGENCYGRSKLDMLQEHLDAIGVDLRSNRPSIRFYSDDRSDLPCLQWADEGIVVSPKQSFLRDAQKLGLPVVKW